MDEYYNMMRMNEEIMERKDEEEIHKLRNDLKNYNMLDFLKKVSALMLFPINQSKSVIFQCMISTALSIPKDEINNSNNMSIGKFRKIVNKFQRLHRRVMVDPPEFPFVLPIMYYDNYHVYMGANSLSASNLNTLLKTLMVHKTEIDIETYSRINKIILGLLNISEDIFIKTKLDFKEQKSYNKDEDIYIPSAELLIEYEELIEFSDEYVLERLNDTVDELTCKFGDIKKEDISDFNNQIFYDKPLIRTNKGFIILDVTTIISLIMKKTIEYLIENKKMDIIKLYNEYTKINLTHDFFRLKHSPIDSRVFNLSLINSDNYCESMYTNGNDEIIIDIMLFDDGKDFMKHKDYKITLKEDYISKRISIIKNKLIQRNIDENKIVTIVTPTTIGRNMYFSTYQSEMKDILILSPYEIEAISINEENENLFLQRYLVARKKLKYYEKNSFSELNVIALYVNNGYNFYINDTVDVKETLLYLIGEYSADYILKAYIKEGKHLCNGIRNNTKMEVIKLDGNIYFAPGQLLTKKMNQVYENNNFVLWCITDEIKDQELYNIYKNFIDLIMYWFNQMNDILQEKEAKIIIKIKIEQNYYDFLKIKNTNAELENLLKYEKDGNETIIYLTPELFQYFAYTDNSREKAFIKQLLQILNQEINENELDIVFKGNYKRKTIAINSIEDAYMIPIENKNQIKISHSDENIILDEIGKYLLRELKINYGPIEDDKIINKVVEKLYDELKTKISSYNKEVIIKALYFQYEYIIANLNVRGAYYSNDIACYEEHVDEIKEQYNELNKISVALKFLIELESSLKNTGLKEVSQYDLEFMLAIASEIIEWAYIGDLVHYKMLESPIELLKSNRIGFDHEIMNRAGMAMATAREEKMSPKGKDDARKLDKYISNIMEFDKDEFEEAFIDEFNYTFQEFQEVILFLLENAEKGDQYLDGIIEIDINECINHLKDKVREEVILKILYRLSLQEREDYLKPPEPYIAEDVYPWRFNRELSLSRKPLIIYSGEVIYGYRILSNSIKFLFDLIGSAKFRAKSSKMKAYISKIEKDKGRRFNDIVYNVISENKDIIVDKNVKKINKKKIMSSDNNELGDIDVLCISPEKGIINLIETKDLSLSKNFYEMHNEYKKMFDFNDEKSFYNKHMKRVNWVAEHIEDIKAQYNLPNKRWKITYLFVVDDNLISKDVFKVKVNITTLKNLTRDLLFK